jgi:hypothetical protein
MKRILVVALCLTAILFMVATICVPEDVFAAFDFRKIPDKANIVAAIISGFFMSISVVGGFYWNQKKANRALRLDTWKYMTELREKHQGYATLRMKLRGETGWVRGVFLGEMREDGKQPRRIDGFAAYFPDVLTERKKDDDGRDFVFLREVTDYFYFFEGILSYGELTERMDREMSVVLIDHFGWFVRNLLYDCCCDGKTPEIRGGQRRFLIYYMAENRYRRLTEVLLCLYADDSENASPANKAFCEAICALLKSQRRAMGRRLGMKGILKKWHRLLGDAK